MQISVAELIVGFLKRLGVEAIFGMPGAHILPVYDALYDAPIRSVLAKHEQGAAFMAGGYARATRRVGACIATAGPGATNLVTGIANAYADRLPVLAITGETATYIFGRGGLQESSGEGGSVDQVELFRPITRYRKLVERTDYLEAVLNQAAATLLADPPGPVQLALPFNVQKASVDAGVLERIRICRPATQTAYDGQARLLARMLAEARRPVIIAGHGCLRAGAETELASLSRALGIPVATSLKAKGALAEDDPLALGSLGVTSSGEAYRFIVAEADLLLILGASFGERTSYVWDADLLKGKRIVQVDLDPHQLGRVFQPDLAIQGDIRAVLAAVLGHLPNEAGPPPLLATGSGAKRGETRSDYAMFREGFAIVQYFFQALARHFPRDTLVFDDNIIFAQNFYRVVGNNRYFPNTGISALGHAIPAAIGARLGASVEQPIFAILGDGGFQMCGMELMTAVNHGLPLNVVLFSNGTMGLVRKNQYQHYRQRYIGCDFINPDFGLLARAFGIAHRRVLAESDVDAVFAELDLRRGINLIEIVLDRDLFPNYSSRR
ncbi:MAG: thiamine pyrophosphate-binding protein [Thiobacillaceae bacterium]